MSINLEFPVKVGKEQTARVFKLFHYFKELQIKYPIILVLYMKKMGEPYHY